MKYLIPLFLSISFFCFSTEEPFVKKKKCRKPNKEEVCFSVKAWEQKEKLMRCHFERISELLNSIEDQISFIAYDSLYQALSDLEYTAFIKDESLLFDPRFEFP